MLAVVFVMLSLAFGDPMPAWSFVLFLLIASGYYVALEAATGSTLSKMAFGLCVVKANGGPYRIGAVLLRNLLRPIDGIFFYLVGLICIAVSSKRQRLGDIVAGTLVVEVTSVAPAMRRSGPLWSLAAAGGVVVLNALLATAIFTLFAAYKSARESPGGGCQKGDPGDVVTLLVLLLLTAVTLIVAFRAARALRTNVDATVGLTALLLLPFALFEFGLVAAASVCD